MDYEKAWKNLKTYTGILSWASFRFAESEDMNDAEHLQAEGGELMGKAILNFMSELEKEMTTAGQDDGQSAQD
ncbi:hypothetical protein [Murdochiella massiliensis]|uniref:hypothetical protein n=1 Tax=Murdochiella massiliensis TaxID=1673723 RepID=UPI000829B562|nr:hypothetical protein [Murdochiella massiliensis]